MDVPLQTLHMCRADGRDLLAVVVLEPIPASHHLQSTAHWRTWCYLAMIMHNKECTVSDKYDSLLRLLYLLSFVSMTPQKRLKTSRAADTLQSVGKTAPCHPALRS